MLAAFFWAYYGANAMVIPFLALILARNGLTPTTVGVVLGAHSLAMLAAAPIWGTFADRADSPTVLLRRALMVLVLVGVVLVAHPPTSAVVVLTTVLAAVDAGAGPLADRMALAAIRAGRRGNYGGTRAFGSLGWICVAPVAGLLADRFPISVLFGGYALLLVPAVILSTAVREESTANDPVPEGRRRGDTASAAHGEGRRGSVALLAVALILHQFIARSLFRFEPLFLDSLGVRMTAIGVASAIPALVELAGMPFGAWLERRVGPRRVVLAGFVIYVVRMVIVRAWTVAPVIVMTKVLDGIEFSFVLVGTVGAINARWHRGSVGTLLALLTVSLPQMVQLVASPVSGVLFERFGGAALYSLGAAGSGLAAVVLGIREIKSLAVRVRSPRSF